MNYVLGAILILASIFLVVAVLMQSSKSHRLSGTIAGGAETFFGKTKGSSIDKKLSKLTTIVAIIFAVLVLVVYLVQDDMDDYGDLADLGGVVETGDAVDTGDAAESGDAAVDAETTGAEADGE